jgi:hypothetical protein
LLNAFERFPHLSRSVPSPLLSSNLVVPTHKQIFSQIQRRQRGKERKAVEVYSCVDTSVKASGNAITKTKIAKSVDQRVKLRWHFVRRGVEVYFVSLRQTT